MLSVPYSRYIFGNIPWYSFLIVIGAALAIVLAIREEKRAGIKKDTVIDFSLIVIPFGIIGARLYYVAFSWDSFKNDFVSVFRIWEGGIAIYGAVIAGLIAALFFCRIKHIRVSTLCDLIAPGLVLAQAIGRWGNYFNQEAYGLPVTEPWLCFFPFAVSIQYEGLQHWHMATFFYESVWNAIVFVFLLIARRKMFRYSGDVFLFYAYLYACGRLIIEDFRMDSLYATSSIRVSQLLSVIICAAVILRYIILFRRQQWKFPPIVLGILILFAAGEIWMFLLMTGFISLPAVTVFQRFLVLLAGSLVNIVTLFVLYTAGCEGEIIYAHVKS